VLEPGFRGAELPGGPAALWDWGESEQGPGAAANQGGSVRQRPRAGRAHR